MSQRNLWWRDYLDECREWWNEFLRAPATKPLHAWAILAAHFDLPGDVPICAVPPGWIWQVCPYPFCTQREHHLGAHG